jgi:hypothetical protein
VVVGEVGVDWSRVRNDSWDGYEDAQRDVGFPGAYVISSTTIRPLFVD